MPSGDFYYNNVYYTGNAITALQNVTYSYPLVISGAPYTPPSLENTLRPETPEAWLRRRVKETCDASGIAA